MLRVTTSRGQCELACPSRTTERGGEGDCVKGGGEGEGERERERAGLVGGPLQPRFSEQPRAHRRSPDLRLVRPEAVSLHADLAECRLI